MSSVQFRTLLFAAIALFIMPLCIQAKYNAAREFTLTDVRFKQAVLNAFDQYHQHTL